MSVERVQLDYRKVTKHPINGQTVVLTQKQLEQLLDVSAMTIYLWRKDQKDLFPCNLIPTEGGRHRIYFIRHEVASWLGRNRPEKLRKIGGGNEHLHARARAGRASVHDPQRAAA